MSDSDKAASVSRRVFVRAAYVAPAILTLKAIPSFAGTGSRRGQIDDDHAEHENRAENDDDGRARHDDDGNGRHVRNKPEPDEHAALPTHREDTKDFGRSEVRDYGERRREEQRRKDRNRHTWGEDDPAQGSGG